MVHKRSEPMPAKPDTNALLMVPNNDEGREFLLQFHKYLNRDKYATKARGRKPNIAKMIQLGFYGSFAHRCGDYILPVCDEHHIYIYTREHHIDGNSKRCLAVTAGAIKYGAQKANENYQLKEAIENIYVLLHASPLVHAVAKIKAIAGKYTDGYIKRNCTDNLREIKKTNIINGVHVDTSKF